MFLSHQGYITYLRLATDRFLDICHGREERFVVGTPPSFTSFYATQNLGTFATPKISALAHVHINRSINTTPVACDGQTRWQLIQYSTVPCIPRNLNELYPLRHSRQRRPLHIRTPHIQQRRSRDLGLKGLADLRGLYKKSTYPVASVCAQILRDSVILPSLHVTLEAMFLQLNFPVLLRESTGTATP